MFVPPSAPAPAPAAEEEEEEEEIMISVVLSLGTTSVSLLDVFCTWCNLQKMLRAAAMVAMDERRGGIFVEVSFVCFAFCSGIFSSR